MKKLLTILITVCMLASFFALPSAASGEISIKEVYFFADGEEIMEVKAGDVSSKLLVSNSGDDKNINVFIALYDEEMRLEGVKRASGVLNAGADEQVVRVPAISVSDADNREVRVFLWDKENFGVPADGKKVLKTENTETLKSITLFAEGNVYNGTINPDTKEITFDFSAYVMGGNSSAMPDLADAYFETEGTQLRTKDGEIDFSKPMTLISSGEGPTEKYTVNSKQYIVLKSDDAEGSRPGIASERVAINGYNNNSVTSVPRPKSGSDEAGEGNALKFPAKPTTETIYVDRTTAKGLSGYPKVADEIIFSFDIRYDGFEYSGDRTSPFGRGDIILGRGTRYNANGSTYAITFARSNEFLPDGLDFDHDTQYVIGALGGSSNAGRHKKLNSPALDMGKWYSVKQVMKVNHKTGEFSYDFYLDGAHIGTIANDTTDTWVPDGVIIPNAVATDGNGTFNWYAQTNNGTGVDYYLDNIKVEYSYGKNDKNVFLVGDSLMSETIDTTSAKQGIGKYISQFIEDAGLSIINTAKAGHQAKFYLEGGANNDTTFAADWQGIKTQLGSEDAVIVSIGANDWAYRADKAELLEDLKEIIGDAKSKGAQVLVSSQTPDFDYDGGKFKQRTEVNECLKTAADFYAVPYVDMGAEFEKQIRAEVEGDNTLEFLADQYYVGFDKSPADWTHLNEKGAELAAEILVGFINENVDFGDKTADATVIGASVSFEGIGKFEGLVNPKTHEITFYVDSAKYASLDSSGNVTLASYSSDDLFKNFNDYLKIAKVNIKTNALVENNGVAQDFSNGSVTYKVGDEDWKVSIIETNVQQSMTADDGLLIKDDRLDLPTSKVGTLCWESKSKGDVETSIIAENGNNIFSFNKETADTTSGAYAFQNMQASGTTKQVESTLAVNSVDIKIDELNEEEGFYFGFSTSRETSGERQNLPSIDNSKGALLFTRSGKQVIDDKISIKYVNDFTDKELKAIAGAPEIDFNKWYNVTTVQKATESSGSYTVTTEVYIDNIYVGEFSGNYENAIYRNIMVQFGSWSDSETTFGVKLDNLKTSYITTESDIK